MVVGTVVLDGIQYAEETVDDLVRKHIFLYFHLFGLWIELGRTHSRINCSVDRFAV